jgi:hypothetical protein
MRAVASLSGLLSRLVVKATCYRQRERDEGCRTRLKESGQNLGNAATIFETLPTGVTFLVGLGIAIGATKSVA